MKKLNIFLLILALFVPILTQNFEKGDPEDLGFIEGRLNRVDLVIKQAIKNGEIPGAVALIARKGKIVYHKSFGYADLKSKKKMENNAIFRIASMSKAITSVGVMILYERGYFTLQDPVSKYIPEFKNSRIIEKIGKKGKLLKTKPSKKEIKIIDLLTHSSGISYAFIKNKMQIVYKAAGVIDGLTKKKVFLKDQIKLLSTLPLMFEPGSKFQYGLSTDVLGYLIQVVSGKPLDTFLTDEIFTPLKMEDTYFYLPEHKKKRLVTLYSWKKSKGLIAARDDESDLKMDNPDYPKEGAKTYFSGGAGLSSTAIDYARFIQMLLNDGELSGVRIISRKSVELMRTPRIDWDNDKIADFGFGFYIINDIAKEGILGSNGTYSWGGAFYTLFWIDPRENLIAVFMTQLRPNQTDIGDKFKTMVYQSLK